MAEANGIHGGNWREEIDSWPLDPDCVCLRLLKAGSYRCVESLRATVTGKLKHSKK
jgi:hypothetical protein